ncbi:MAG: LPP20 family lipoprotein [Elusimicrobia bacterium]|nr:LPP20 family lipoprotein [Elusimicrobiota bacterium]
MKRIIVGVASVFCVWSLSVSLWAAKAPAWVNGQDPAYPDSTFITGVGVAKDLDGARSNARAEISKVFQARIQQSLTDTQTESSASVDNRRGPALGTQESEMSTKVTTDSLLEGVQIAAAWFDKKKNKQYALAVLNKPNLRRTLSTQITEKEEAIQARLSQAKAAPTPIEKAKGYAQALRLCRERGELSARRRVVDPAGMADLSLNGSEAEIQKSLDESLAKIQFVVEAEGETDSRLKDALKDRITRMGFKVSETADAASTPDDPVLKVKGRLAIEPFDRGNPSWKFFKWNGVFEMSEAAPGGKVLSASTPSGSEGHITEGTAYIRTREKGEQALAQEAQDRISKYIFGDK